MKIKELKIYKSDFALYVLIAAIFILTLLLFLMIKSHTSNLTTGANPSNTSADNSAQNDSSAGTAATAATTVTRQEKTNKSKESLSYEQAVAKYRDRRIQFDEKCQALPANPTFKSGESIMLDNRAGFTRAIKIGKYYSIDPYGFEIIKLSSSILPLKIGVNCNQNNNVATILLQK